MNSFVTGEVGEREAGSFMNVICEWWINDSDMISEGWERLRERNCIKTQHTGTKHNTIYNNKQKSQGRTEIDSRIG